jgi:hypothetical protein
MKAINYDDLFINGLVKVEFNNIKRFDD